MEDFDTSFSKAGRSFASARYNARQAAMKAAELKSESATSHVSELDNLFESTARGSSSSPAIEPAMSADSPLNQLAMLLATVPAEQVAAALKMMASNPNTKQTDV